MCWYNTILIPIKLKKSIIVYKVGIKATSNLFSCKYVNHIYWSQRKNPTILLEPKIFTKHRTYDIYIINRGYHSYLSLLTPALGKDLSYLGKEIGVFEISKGATIYINKHGEIVSSDIKYLHPL